MIYHRSYSSTLDAPNRMLDEAIELMEQHGVPQKLLWKVTVAISEAFTNALVHGNGCNPEKLIHLELEVNECEIRADITDQGNGGLAQIRAHRPVGPSAERGRGIGLMRLLAVSTEFSECADGGLRVSLSFEKEKKTEIFER